jgi:hypothetical protein
MIGDIELIDDDCSSFGAVGDGIGIEYTICSVGEGCEDGEDWEEVE